MRSIRVDAYARDDGLWDVEPVLVDTRSRDLQLASGLRAAGDPIHEIRLQVTVERDLNVHDAVERKSFQVDPLPCTRDRRACGGNVPSALVSRRRAGHRQTHHRQFRQRAG